MSVTLLSDEQRFVREAAEDALGRLGDLERVRAALDGEPLADAWPTAVEAGWSGLLVPEAAQGAGLGPAEATIVAERAGNALAPLPLIGHLSATALLATADPEHRRLPELARGEVRAALVAGEEVEFGGGKVTGGASWVLDAAGAELLVVADGRGAGLIEAGASGLEVSREECFDPTLNAATVRFDDGVEAESLPASGDAAGFASALEQLLLAASMAGTGRAALDLGVSYAQERLAFARPIGSFQAVKHGLVEVLRQLELVEVLIRDAGSDPDSDQSSFRVACLAARVAADRAIDTATRTCMAVHGGIGVTWEHDAPLYFRRAQLARRLLGGSDAAADALAGELLAGPKPDDATDE